MLGWPGERPAAASATATGYLGHARWEREPTLREANGPEAKETHQAQDGGLTGDRCQPKPLPAGLPRDPLTG